MLDLVADYARTVMPETPAVEMVLQAELHRVRDGLFDLHAQFHPPSEWSTEQAMLQLFGREAMTAVGEFFRG